jgi:hypothetical protein
MPGFKTLTGMTGTGSAVELAEMLRQMGRGRDTVLAHITPEEAQMLMDMGGSGTTNPNTGLPEFLDIYGGDDSAFRSYDVEAQPEGFYGGREPTFEEFQRAQPPMDMTGFRQPTGFEQAMAPQEMPPGMRFDLNVPPATQPVDITSPVYRQPFAPFERAGLPEAPQQPGFLQTAAQGIESTAQQYRDLARQYPTVARLLSTGATTLPALIQSMRARREGERRAEEFRRLGAPLREQGEALRQQALAGQLTPQQAAAQEAARARLRQTAATRGATTGTQAAMIEGQLERQRAQLSETNLNNALKQLNLANAYDEAAIKAKLASDQEITNSIANIFANLGRDITSQQNTQQPQTQRPNLSQQPEVTRRPDIRG